MTNENSRNFEEVKARLDEIVDAVSDDEISLDNALDLYEEAVKLGMQVSSVLEEDIAADQISAGIESLEPLENEASAPESGDVLSDETSGEAVEESDELASNPEAVETGDSALEEGENGGNA